jgi:hypothetical protein
MRLFLDTEFNGFGGKISQYDEFAQLIIRECAKVANENVGAFTPSCGNFVLDHFGVER